MLHLNQATNEAKTPQNPSLVTCVQRFITSPWILVEKQRVSCCDSRRRESGTWTGSKWVHEINLESIQMRFGAAWSTRGDWTSLALCTFNLLYDCCVSVLSRAALVHLLWRLKALNQLRSDAEHLPVSRAAQTGSFKGSEMDAILCSQISCLSRQWDSGKGFQVKLFHSDADVGR